MPPLPAIGEPPLPAELFDLDPEILWLLHCAEGPVPKATAQAVQDFLPREMRPWLLRWEGDFQAIPRETRTAAAMLLGAQPQDISLTATTSSALVTLAQVFPWQPGDQVLSPSGEFPTNAWPWLALRERGVTVQQVPLWEGHRAGLSAWHSTPPPPDVDPEGRLLAALDVRTRLLTVSWVRFQDGLVLDLRRLAQGAAQRGIPLIVDGIQGAGTLPIALEGIAAFASSGHKGLLAPQGIGIFWTQTAFRERLLPAGSWLSVVDATDLSRPSTDLERDWLPDGRRFEAGGPNLLGCVALRESLRLLHQAGVPRIAAHIARLRRVFLESLQDLPGWRAEAQRLLALDTAGRLGSIVALHHGDRGPVGLDRVLRQLLRHGIYASVREGYLRIAFHGWHREIDVLRLLSALAEG